MMIRRIAQRMMASLMLTAIMVSTVGCQLSTGDKWTPGKLRRKSLADPGLGSVSVNRWLESEKEIPITEESAQLGTVLSKSVNAENEILKRQLLAANDRGSIKVNSKMLSDNCVVLVRGNQYWYFPMLMVSFSEVSKIRLQPGDTINTVPLNQIVFAKPNEVDRVELMVHGLRATEVEKLALEGNNLTRLFTHQGSWPADGEWSATVVSRLVGSTLHHFVTPSNRTLYGRPVIGAYQGLFSDAQLKFQSGDVAELTDLSLFSERFDLSPPILAEKRRRPWRAVSGQGGQGGRGGRGGQRRR